MKKISRRFSIKVGLTAPLWLANMNRPLVAASTVANEPPVVLRHLILALLATGKPVCATVAENLMELPENTNRYDLHLRNAALDSADVKALAEAIATVNTEGGPQLQSFSLSYNSNVGDEGALTLARTLPSTLTEIGLVNCDIGDTGGNALLDWASTAGALHWLCVEGNAFSDRTKTRFIEMGKQRSGLSVIV